MTAAKVEFSMGEPVAKVGGDYRFDGWIVGHVWKRSGALRYAVEDDRGVLHIFNERQICRRQEIDAKLKGGDRHTPERTVTSDPEQASDIATPAASPAPAAGRPFKVGDRVRVESHVSSFFGQTGTVQTVHWSSQKSVGVQIDGDEEWWFGTCQLVHLDPAQPAQDAVPAAGEAERLDKRLREIARDPTHTLGPRGVLIEAAILLTRQAGLIRTLVREADYVCWFDWSDNDEDAQDAINALRAALDAARAMGFGKEGE